MESVALLAGRGMLDWAIAYQKLARFNLFFLISWKPHIFGIFGRIKKLKFEKRLITVKID